MEEPTTTVDPVETGADAALPVQDAPVAADATTTVEPSEPSDGGVEAPVPVDDKLQSFAKGQGIDDISELSERELKLLKVAKDNQAEFQRNRQKSSELEKAVQANSDEIATQVAQDTGQDPELLKIVRGLQVNQAVRDFWDAHPEAKQYEQDMIKVHGEKPYLAGDLEALYATALVRSGGLDTVKSQGKREALTNLAQKQQATAPIGNATNSGAPKAKPFKELSIAEMEAQLGFVRR